MKTTEANSSVQKHINIFFVIMIRFVKFSIFFLAKIGISLWLGPFGGVFCDFIGKDISLFIAFTDRKVFALFYFVVYL